MSVQTVFSEFYQFIHFYGAPLLTLVLVAAMITTLQIRKIQHKKKSSQPLATQSIHPSAKPYTQTITSKDIRAIAGDDVIATQLDLARAYLEMGKNNLAKKMLVHVIEKGQPAEREAANQLLSNL